MPVANCFRHSPCKKKLLGVICTSEASGGFAQRARSRMISMHFLRRSVKSSSFMALQTDRPIFPIARARVGPGRSKGARRASCRCQATDGRRRQFHLAVVESFSDALAALYFVELNFQWLRFKKAVHCSGSGVRAIMKELPIRAKSFKSL